MTQMYDPDAQRLDNAQQKLRDLMVTKIPDMREPLGHLLYVPMANASVLMLIQVAIIVRLHVDG